MARRLRGRAWGNALGGWRRQKRDARGRFTKGSGGRSRSKAVAKPSRKARRHARLSQERVIISSTSYDLRTGRAVSRTTGSRTGYEQRSFNRHRAVGAIVGTAVMPGAGTAMGIIIGTHQGAKKNPLRVRHMPI